MRVADARPGLAVVYAPKHGAREDGVVTSVSGDFVFVRFEGQHPTAMGKACLPRDLEPAAGSESNDNNPGRRAP